MTYDHAFFDAGIQRRGTRCVKWDAQAMCGGDDLPMWVADWDFRCAEPIVQAICGRAEHPCYGYSSGDPKDKQSFADFWLRRHRLAILPEQTCMLPSVVTGLRQAVITNTKPGDAVMIFTPVYGPFRRAVEQAGRSVAACSLLRRADGGYDVDFEAVERLLKTGVRLMMFCNPHNPVSRSWRREELTRLVNLANAYQAVLVSDEIHADFVYQPLEHVPMLSIPGAEKCVLMLASASKTFNLPGLQQAMAVSRNEDILRRLKENLTAQGIESGNIFGLAAAQAAYTACDDWLDGMIAYLDEGRGILRQELSEQLPKAVLAPVEATALSWIDLRAYAPTCDALNEKLRRAHLVLNKGTDFDPELGEGFMRLNFGCPHASLREGVRRMAKALKE